MPRYFFHITDGQKFRDVTGTDLPSLSEARREAVNTFGDLAHNKAEWKLGGWQIDVCDAEGRTLMTLSARIEEAYRADG